MFQDETAQLPPSPEYTSIKLWTVRTDISHWQEKTFHNTTPIYECGQMCLFGFSERLPLALVVRGSNNLTETTFKTHRSYATQSSSRQFLNPTCSIVQHSEYISSRIKAAFFLPASLKYSIENGTYLCCWHRVKWEFAALNVTLPESLTAKAIDNCTSLEKIGQEFKSSTNEMIVRRRP